MFHIQSGKQWAQQAFLSDLCFLHAEQNKRQIVGQFLGLSSKEEMRTEGSWLSSGALQTASETRRSSQSSHHAELQRF